MRNGKFHANFTLLGRSAWNDFRARMVCRSPARRPGRSAFTSSFAAQKPSREVLQIAMRQRESRHSRWIFESEGRKWGVRSVVVGFGVFGGAPIFSPEVRKYLFLKGFRASGLKIGAPPKTPNSTTTDLTPHLRPSDLKMRNLDNKVGNYCEISRELKLGFINRVLVAVIFEASKCL